jgi:hypothetical protein
MNDKLDQGKKSLEKIKLFMNYSLKKTLSENILEQENFMTNSDLMLQDREKELSAEKEKNKTAWKKRCRYPDKAMLPPKNKAGVEGKDALIDGFCYYPAPSKNGVSGIYIPEDSEINWWTIEKINYAVDQHLKENPKENRKDSIRNFSQILPLGTVSSFKVKENRYVSWVTFDKATGLWEFKYFYNKLTNMPYQQPEWVDKREPYQKFIDEYGTAIQITAALATAAAGFLSGGAAWVLWAEIVLEGGLGVAVGIRDVQKGENVGAALSFITGVLPMLKLSKTFTGIPKKEFAELSEELANAGLTKSSDVSKYVEFYNGLSPTKQKIMSKLLKQDDNFKGQLLKSLGDELPDIANASFKKMIKENPELLKKIPFFERLWVRELETNALFIVILTLINVVYGDVLNAKDKERLDGVYSKIPESLKKEMAFNLLANGDKAKEILETDSFKSIEKIVNTKEIGTNIAEWVNTKLKDSITQVGRTYVELPDDTSISVQNINKEKKDENIFRKQGWIPRSELKDGQETYDMYKINGVNWVKVTPN